ncbi:MAG: RidA family protein [Nitrospinota bacterium]
MPREYIKGTWQEEERAYSPAVVTRGGKIVWLAGAVAGMDDEDDFEPVEGAEAFRHPLAGDFDAQARSVFRNLGKTLERAGGKLQDIVTMTVFIVDVRTGDRFVKIRKEYFPEGKPASALITVAGLAHPDLLIEIQAIAVIGDE